MEAPILRDARARIPTMLVSLWDVPETEWVTGKS